MKFGARYEILRAVTRGSVETFAARDRNSGEQVVAHIFKCSEPPADQPTAGWILTSFSNMAPASVGPVLDVGRYDVSSFAYIVTSWPGDTVLENWVKSYQGGSAAENTTVSAEAAGASVAPRIREQATPVIVNENVTESTQPVEVTSPPLQPHEAVAPADCGNVGTLAGSLLSNSEAKEPGEFTRKIYAELESFGMSGRRIQGADIQPPFGSDKARASIPKPEMVGQNEDIDSQRLPDVIPHDGSWPNEERTGGFTKLFGPEIQAATPPKLTDEAGVSEKAATGEFTRIFPASSTKEPPQESDFQSAAEKRTSITGFTEFFGPARRNASDTPDGSITNVLENSVIDRPKSPLSSNFERDDSELRFGTSANIEREDLPAYTISREPISGQAFRTEGYTGEIHPLSGSRPDADATRIFAPQTPGAPSESAADRGPSEWTQFISRSSLAVATHESGNGVSDGVDSASRSGAASKPALASAGPSSPVSFAPAPISVHIPGGPPLPTPSMPPVTPPTVPAPAAGIAKDTKGKFSYWPLILILNLLFIIAVLLVVFFLLKR